MGEENIRDSILLTVKKMLGGLEEANDHFNDDLIVIINSTFMVMAQLGIGPEQPYRISGPENTWDEFECFDLESVKEYLYLKTKLVFDPPQNGSVSSALEARADQLEWRLMIFSEDLRNAEQVSE